MNCGRHISLHFFSLMLMAVLGCGAGSSLPADVETGTVSGTITSSAGTFPEGCFVSFQPEAGTLLIASGVMDSNGYFQLSLREMADIPTGVYKVTVQPPALPPLTEEEVEREMLEGITIDRTNQIDQIPLKYMSVKTTPETFKVVVGSNDVTIELKD